ncbi:hypothetical protein [Nonlabens xiamenensis]|uniref:hypothetical protein n=1 Tax=Nonlabens xiamenensis TaxID=2341043 RepID=UPI000F60EC41|nr:hypothetical protein [Nonlabens xiamenensis]
MKKMLLFIAVGLMTMTTAQAAENHLNETNDFPPRNHRYRNVQPVLFTYNNVDYAIFPDGRVDFELPNHRWNNQRSSVNRRYHVNRSNIRNRQNGLVRYNHIGQVVKIGPTRIFYNGRGNVAKIGRLKVNYRRGVLSGVGGLKVLYNRRGQITAARGHVLVRDFYGHGHDCNDHDFGHFHNDQQFDDRQDWDNGVYFKRKIK